MQGRRLPDGYLSDHFGAFEPGDYMLAAGGKALWVALPTGVFGRLDERWTFTEEWDGSLTVSPSIHDTSPGGYHGYLTRGVWTSV